jgi:hypothetical protein
MGGARLRAGWVSVAIAIAVAACGSRQPVSTTTVSSGGADVAPAPDSTSAEPEPSSEEFGEPKPPVEPSDEVPEDLERRDVKMTSYEDAMAAPIELGDATRDGGEAQLTGEEVARVMDGHLDDMYEACIRKELERGNELGTVTVDVAIRGRDGMVLGATVEPGRRRFKKCIIGYLEDVRFPAFASPRMGARYRFRAG